MRAAGVTEEFEDPSTDRGAREEIDELVYELYGLGAKNREVIEEFLKKF